ncbi:phytanoyl-CoA dioxygenase family protein [Tenggerimyces flavus]|uniref:Phytanoyl-CoA dioxygenase family protein n=1 Tax=Tenggerimyces flavus TaxID=1708749 RepID=A0ABV7YMI1_9ACTN|nr:phytanoyl-CoA dioxygenase family protein [Tenggerimyces flavus]MBM7784946.1 hypothetical protein [Tenggerimyces flavus]
MLTDAQRSEFDRTGIVKLQGVFSADDAARMREVVWSELGDLYGMRADDPSTWNGDQYLSGLKRTKKHSAFDAILGPALEEALDDVLGPGWERPKHQGQVLVTMPDSAEWRVPHQQWHTDVAFEGHPRGVKHWAFFDKVEPGGGGTVQLAGSHRLLSRYLEGKSLAERELKTIRDGFLRSHPWLRMLTRDDGAPDRNERLMTETDLDGLPARVVELTGEPGDVYLTDLWIMHARPRNASSRPRLMRSRVYSAGGE